MNKELRNTLSMIASAGLSIAALIIFAVCIFGEHDSTLVAIGLGLVCCSNLLNIVRTNQNKKEEK